MSDENLVEQKETPTATRRTAIKSNAMGEKSHKTLLSRRAALKSVGGLSLAPIFALPVKASQDNPTGTTARGRVIHLNPGRESVVSQGMVKIYENGNHLVRLKGKLRNGKHQTARYQVEVNNPDQISAASATLTTTSGQQHPERGEMGSGSQQLSQNASTSASAETEDQQDSLLVSPTDHGNKDNQRDFQSGAIVNSRPHWTVTNRLETKQYATWTASGGEVDWINRYYCWWHDIGYVKISAGFVDIDWGGDTCWTRAYADYRTSPDDGDRIYHRINLTCEPDGQCAYESEHWVNANNGYYHGVFLEYKDNRENC